MVSAKAKREFDAIVKVVEEVEKMTEKEMRVELWRNLLLPSSRLERFILYSFAVLTYPTFFRSPFAMQRQHDHAVRMLLAEGVQPVPLTGGYTRWETAYSLLIIAVGFGCIIGFPLGLALGWWG